MTHKAQLLLGLGLILNALDILCAIIFWGWIAGVGVLILSIILSPAYLISAHIMILPLDIYLKKKIIAKAKAKLQTRKDLQIIAITGSYGKTTTKEILATILSEYFKVLSTPGTKNTPLGVSEMILRDLNEEHKILIIEMGAYCKGNITELCELTHPNISLLTGITLQHLERFKSLENIIDAKFEILECLGEKDFAVVNTTSKGVQRGLKQKELKVLHIEKVKSGTPYEYKKNLGGLSFKIDGHLCHTKLLSPYIIEIFEMCYKVADHLDMPFDLFVSGLEKVDFIEHRMQLIHNTQTNVYVIDDSFNGNLEGAKAIAKLMSEAPFNGRKILIAGGVVELGDKNSEVNAELGILFAQVADIVLLVEGPVGNAIENGLLKAKFQSSNIQKFKKPLELHNALGGIVQSGDMVVFQNDLSDQYL